MIILRHALFTIFLLVAFNGTNAQQAAIRPKIKRIVDQLQKDDMVHFGYAVGYSGVRETKNKFYRRYLKLRKKSTDFELLELTKTHSTLIKVYTFDILLHRQYAGMKDLFLLHVSDTAWFWTASGCTGVVDRVNWFMLCRLAPNNKEQSKNILTREEYAFYCSRFKQDDELFNCN